MLPTTLASAAPSLQRFDVPPWLWVGFLAGVAALLLFDLLVVHRHAHEISLREALVSSAAWVALGVGFVGVVAAVLGATAAGQYITGYVIEKSLSVDNVFVWAVIFSYFAVPAAYQHRVLFWGIFGALALRAGFIFAGVALLERLDWLLFVFGGFLLFTAVRIVRHEPGDLQPEQNPVLRLVRRFVPMSAGFDGQRLFTRAGGRLLATPLFAVLVLVEATDVVFAVDSVPAILAISRDPFIVFSSNAMAILGLRALYFLLAGARARLVYLNEGLGVILFLVGVKMIVSRWYHVNAFVSLVVIAAILGVTILVSLRHAPTAEAPVGSSTDARHR